MYEPKHTIPKGETPTSDQAPGVLGEQQELFDRPGFCPIPPPSESLAERALLDLLERDLVQPDWFENGWRLAASIKELDCLGWEPKSIRVSYPGKKRPIAQYSLSAKAKQAAYTMLHGGDHAYRQ